jgi:hypothetical protein
MMHAHLSAVIVTRSPSLSVLGNIGEGILD